MATVTSKGQITLPKAVRDALGLLPGTEVEFQVTGGEAVLRKRVPNKAFDRWRGTLRRSVGAKRTDDFMHELRSE